MNDVGLCLEKEQWLTEVPKDQPDELWPPPLWPGHFCRRSLLQLRDSSGLSAQSPPYSFAVRYDLRPIAKQLSGCSAYLMLMDGESLRRIGKGSGLDLVAATKSWIARHSLCAPPQLLAKDADGKLAGEVVAQPDPHLYGNGEGVLLMSVVLTADLKDWRDWRPVGDLMSYRLGSPPVQCGLCGAAVAQRDLIAHQKECVEAMIPCPRCEKRVLIRELSAHQKSNDCVKLLPLSTQTDALETEDVGSQCITPAMLPVAVQTSYASALVSPSISAEEPVPALVPSLAIRWQAPAREVRPLLTEYQLTVSEFMGGDEQWKLLRVELLDIERLERQSSGELRHELTHLRPGTKYRLELRLRAVDGCLGPKAQVTLHTLSRLAGFEGLSEDERLHLASAMVPTGPAQRPESLSVREQATQAGPGFVTGACKSEISREIGVQAFPKVFTETACQSDTLVSQNDMACGPEWPLMSESSVQCKATCREFASQCEVKLAESFCQVQFPPRPYTGDPRAEMDVDMHSGSPGWREVLQQTGFRELLRLVLVLFGNALALAGFLLADLPPQEMWPMLASLIVILPFNALELLFFYTFPPSRHAASKLRIWRRRHANTNLVIQVAVIFVSPDALQFFRAPLQPGGRRFTGVVGPEPPERHGMGSKVPNFVELCAAKCPVCSQLSPIPRIGDLWRSSRFLLYCHVPQLVLALLLLLRRLDAGFTNDLDPVKVALHGSAALAHSVLILCILGQWLLYSCRRRSLKLKVADLTTELHASNLQLKWPQMEEVLCEAWFVIFHSFDKQKLLRIEMLPGNATQGLETPALQLHGVPTGHFWVSVQSYHHSAGLSMPLAMGHCEITEDEELRLRHRDSGVDKQTETKWEVQDASTDPLVPVAQTTEAQVQNVAAAVDAVVQFPAVPVEMVDAATMPAESSSSEKRLCAIGSSVGSFDLPVTLELEDHPEPAAPEGARGLWLSWAPHGLQELAPRLVARARHVSGGGLVDAAMGVSRASFQLEVGRYELLLSCELGICQAEVQACPHQRCRQRFWSHHLEAHLSRCKWQPRPCPRASLGCHWHGCSDELEMHERECVAMELQCKNRHLGCRWVGPGSMEESHLQECPAQRLLDVVEPLSRLLNEACPDYRNPEAVRLLERVVQYRRFVRPCGQWKEWKSSGRCCDCSKTIDRKEKGLQCESPSLRLCWSCMPKHIDWQRLKDDGTTHPPRKSTAK